MATCGKCKETGVSVAHVRACYTQGGGVATLERPVANHHDASGVSLRYSTPDWELVGNLRREVAQYLPGKHGADKIGYFAVMAPEEEGGHVKFYRVKLVGKGRWAGRLFVDVQASDDYWPIKSPVALAWVLAKIAEDPTGAAKLYASELGNCYACNRTLTDPESIALGIGPVCRNK